MNGAFPPSWPSWAEAGKSAPSHRKALGRAVLDSRREPSSPLLGTWGPPQSFKGHLCPTLTPARPLEGPHGLSADGVLRSKQGGGQRPGQSVGRR